ncbi:hypothetical protein N0V93_008959 [Gnomoniopsis smithogilvyi]|uniref:AB hydrolase-1 domain-containing protein n=1 Tax=Gnomoniopsis smithogilvyi TaxID=1191159 RepID=A0A9W9CT86_9PEZI|nr:hypothetical protein N0V93_008959 [Gnomoniopsis smithogilvyi]
MNCHADLAYTVLGPACDERSPNPTNNLSRPPLVPPVLCFHGSGTSSHYDTWLPLIKETSRFAPVLFHERRGVRASASTDPHHPRDALQDLLDLLQHVDLQPPYILVAHSYGGTFAREFLQQYPDQVAGVVLAETGQETPTKHDEEQYRRQALGKKPLSVIHADSLYEKRKAITSDAGLDLLRKWTDEDERLKKAQLQLSSNARYVRVEDCGHDIVRHRPLVVSEEVKWVISNLKPAEQTSKVRLRDAGEYLRARISRLRRQEKN